MYSSSNLDPYFYSRYIHACTALVLFTYTMELSSLFEPFNCVEQDGILVVTHEPTQECYTDAWYAAIPALIFFGCIYLILIPGTLIAILYWYRDSTHTITFRAKFEILTRDYRKKFYWYECVAILKRFLIIVVSETMSYRVSEVATIFVVITVLQIFLLVDMYLQPEIERDSFYHNQVWNVLAILLLSSGIVFSSDSVYNSESVALVFFMIVVLCSMIVFSIGRWYHKITHRSNWTKEVSIVRNIQDYTSDFIFLVRKKLDNFNPEKISTRKLRSDTNYHEIIDVCVLLHGNIKIVTEFIDKMSPRDLRSESLSAQVTINENPLHTMHTLPTLRSIDFRPSEVGN